MIKRPNLRSDRRRARYALAGFAVFCHAAVASAGIHTWDVVEVFSNHDGTIQYVELLDRGTSGNETGVGSSSISSSLTSFSWSGSVTAPTNGKSFLIATGSFAALPGAPVPDVIIPPANIPFFDTAGDTITFASVDSLTFAAVPIDGIDSLTEPTAGASLVTGANTPKNYAGTQGSVNAGGPPSLPSISMPMGMLGISLLLGVGYTRLRKREIA